MSISQVQADAVIAAAREAADEIGVPMNIAVFDDGANLKAFLRMDGALLGSADIALGKAKTAALFGCNTEVIGEFCKPGGTSPGLDTPMVALSSSRAAFPSIMRTAGSSAPSAYRVVQSPRTLKSPRPRSRRSKPRDNLTAWSLHHSATTKQ
jgi:hypothetical protein